MEKKCLTADLGAGLIKGKPLEALTKAMEEVQGSINALLHKYEGVDAPFIAAGMYMAVNALKSNMSPGEKGLYKALTEGMYAQAVKINLSELKKQAANGGS